jgi:hypothetical protein
MISSVVSETDALLYDPFPSAVSVWLPNMISCPFYINNIQGYMTIRETLWNLVETIEINIAVRNNGKLLYVGIYIIGAYSIAKSTLGQKGVPDRYLI